MTREEAKELLPIMQAFVDGKKIEYSNDGEDWIETETPTWDTDYVYRINPESMYRPFSTQEECWNEMHKHPDFGWLYYKKKGYYVSIDAMGDRVGMNGQKFVEVLSDYTFTDGEPFGIKEK